jgi:serine/threonine protein kinase
MNELRRITERYLLEKQVAASAGVALFRATDIESGATVAVELIHGDEDGAAEWRQQFLETARAVRSLDHPSLPRVLDFGITHAGGAFLVTGYVDGFHPSYQEIREALRLVLFGEPGSLPPARPEP